MISPEEKEFLMRSDEHVLTRGISIFSTLSEEHFDDILSRAYLQLFPAHVQLIEEGDHAEFLFVIVEGAVELFCSSKDREITMIVLKPVSFFNLSAVLEGTVYSMSARTKEKTRILMIPAENVRNVIEVDPVFAKAMVAELAKRYRILIKSSKEQRLYSGVERLVMFLLREHEQLSSGQQIEITLDRRTLASLLGMSREHLSRGFAKLREYGVEVEGDHIYLARIDDLRQFAEQSHLKLQSKNVTP